MRKSLLRAVTAGALLVVPLAATAQSQTFSFESTHYLVTTDVSEAYAQTVATVLEAGLDLFNELFHFDIDEQPARLRVRVFGDKVDYDAYLSSLISEPRDDYVYIHYNDLSKSELVGFDRSDDFTRSLLHLGAIQFLKSFVPHAPLWLREGTAAYLENAAFDQETGTFQWQPNLVWLDTLKATLDGTGAATRIPIRQLLRVDSEASIHELPAFYPQSWGLVHFLMQTPDKQMNRVLWDSIAALSPQRTLRENSDAVVRRAFAWVDIDRVEAEAEQFLLGLNTFGDLLETGIAAYGETDLKTAADAFQEALTLDDSSYIPYYYLGLIDYANRDYPSADTYYQEALARSDNVALVRYALGVNAFADSRYQAATENLVMARDLDTSTYGEKVDALLQRIDVLQ